MTTVSIDRAIPPDSVAMPARPIRVLQVNSAFNLGGTDRHTLELSIGLVGLGADVTLSVPASSRWVAEARAGGVRLDTFRAPGPLKLAVIAHWASVLRARKVEIVHAHQGRDYWPAVLAAQLAGGATRVVVSRHLMTRPAGFSRRFLLGRADVVALSRAVEGVVRRELRGPASRIHQLYGGVTVEPFVRGADAGLALRAQLGWARDQVVFGVVGAYDLPRGKGQFEFLEAAHALVKRCPKARFAIVGAGTMREQLLARISDLGLRDRVTMVPFTPDVPAVMNALDVLVHPAVGSEAAPLVIWEALAAGRPVIASRLDGIPETFREGTHGLLVPPGAVIALADAMERLARSPETRARFGAAGRDHVIREHSREAQARRVLAFYHRLIGVGPAEPRR